MKTDNNLLSVTAIVFCLQMSACSSGPPPKQELKITEESIAAAIDAGAESASPDELSRAQSRIKKAKKLIKKKKYDDAEDLLQLATLDARLAQQTAEAKSARTDAML